MTKMNVITERCIGCGQCVKDCVANHLVIENGKAKLKDGSCIECGHCYAICPKEAIVMEEYDCSKCNEVVSFEQIDANVLLEAMKSRRTIRQFKDQPVEKEKIEMILEAGRYTPTAANAQNVAFTILGSRQQEIEAKCVGMFAKAKNMGEKLVPYLKEMNIEEHFFFKGAPLVIIVSSKSDINGGLTSAYMEIMANSLGLGVLYSGFFQTCTKINKKVLKMLELPKGHKVISCMIMGYPAVKYVRQAPRKPLKVKQL